MFLTRLLTTLAHLYNLVGWLNPPPPPPPRSRVRVASLDTSKAVIEQLTSTASRCKLILLSLVNPALTASVQSVLDLGYGLEQSMVTCQAP